MLLPQAADFQGYCGERQDDPDIIPFRFQYGVLCIIPTERLADNQAFSCWGSPNSRVTTVLREIPWVFRNMLARKGWAENLPASQRPRQ
jgi:hypothetical protein